jgi:hypothetical protein
MTPIRLIIVILSCLVITACGSNGDDGTTTSGAGSLWLGLTDASTDQYQAVYVKIDEIQVHAGSSEEAAGNWETIAAPVKTYNLLELVNGVIEELGVSPLDSGVYEQMRLIIGTLPTDDANILGVLHPYANYVIDLDGASHELKIPSGINSGIKIVHGFDISEDETTELILDFDASKSVVQAGNSGNWLLKPTIKVLDTREHAIVRGTVLQNDSRQGIAGALVSHQYETADSEDEMDAVTVEASSVSVEENVNEGIERGDYAILVQPGSYRLVSFKEGYAVECATIGTAHGESTFQDVELAASAMGRVAGSVLINGAGSEQYATLSFRKATPCGGVEATVAVRSISVANGSDYSVRLPAGAYSLVATASGMETEVYNSVNVGDGDVTYLGVGIGY